MITLPYSDRDYTSIFEGIKDIIKTIEPRADVDFDKANIESIIAKVISGCVDTLSYNQDANILEAFPSTSRDPRAVFDLFSVVGYTPKTARSCHVYMTLWNPNFIGERVYNPFNYITIDNRTFYNPDTFKCAQGVTTNTEWYQGTLVQPDVKVTNEGNTFLDKYYPNLSVNVLDNGQYKLPKSHTQIDSRTIRVYLEDGTQLTYVENPYMTYITKLSFSILPSVNSEGYSLIFSKDVSSGTTGSNLYYFYVMSEGYNVGNNLVPNFGGLSVNGETVSFSYAYTADDSHGTETAAEARENIVYEFGWRDTPKAIITTYDAERAVLQNFRTIAAVDVRDSNNYSGCNSSKFEIQIFCKVNEETELILSSGTVDSIKNNLYTHFNKFKMLPLNFTFHIDNVATEDNEPLTKMYYWYPNVTLYMKEQVNSQEAAAVINMVEVAIFDRFSTKNMGFNEVPRVTDVIETIKNATEDILYLDFDGITYVDPASDNGATKEDITCSFTQNIEPEADRLTYDVNLKVTTSTDSETRFIQYNTVKIVNNNNEVIAYDNGDGTLMDNIGYLDGTGTINYETGKMNFKLISPLADTITLQVSYRQETPTFCEYVNSSNSIKIALESLKN